MLRSSIHINKPIPSSSVLRLASTASSQSARSIPIRAFTYSCSTPLLQHNSQTSTTTTISTSFTPGQRFFSTTPHNQLRDFFPAKETERIQRTPPAWPHHDIEYQQMLDVTVAHRPPRTFSDWAAWKIVRVARWCMDKATGMDREQKSDKSQPTTSIAAEKPLTEAQWVGFPNLTYMYSAHPEHG